MNSVSRVKSIIGHFAGLIETHDDLVRVIGEYGAGQMRGKELEDLVAAADHIIKTRARRSLTEFANGKALCTRCGRMFDDQYDARDHVAKDHFKAIIDYIEREYEVYNR